MSRNQLTGVAHTSSSGVKLDPGRSSLLPNGFHCRMALTNQPGLRAFSWEPSSFDFQKGLNFRSILLPPSLAENLARFSDLPRCAYGSAILFKYVRGMLADSLRLAVMLRVL
jgi:hypothetical protein